MLKLWIILWLATVSVCQRTRSYVRINMSVSLLWAHSQGERKWCAFPQTHGSLQKDKWLFTIPYKCITSLFYCHQKCHNSNDGLYTITTATVPLVMLTVCYTRACAMPGAHDNAHRGVFIFTRCRLNLLSWCTAVTFWQAKFGHALKWSRKHSSLLHSYCSQLIQFTLSSALLHSV